MRKPFRTSLVRLSARHLMATGRALCLILLLASHLAAQEAELVATKADQQVPQPAPKSPATHRFWDTPNAALFAGVAGARTLDFISTQHFRKKGVDEVLLTNDIVDNKPLFAAIEVAGVAASIGVSYIFHRTGHHKIERWVSVIHISVGTAGAIRNFGLEPKPSGTTP